MCQEEGARPAVQGRMGTHPGGQKAARGPRGGGRWGQFRLGYVNDGRGLQTIRVVSSFLEPGPGVV